MTNYDQYRKEKILSYVDSIKNGQRIFPVSLQISLTDKCFNKCIMCGHWKRKNKTEINFDDLKNYINFGIENNLESICLSGGDPFAYPKIYDLLKFLNRTNLIYGIITAGYFPIKIKENIDVLKKVSWVRCSVDTIDSGLYKKIRGDLNINKILNDILFFKREGIKVEFGITLHKLNQEYIFDVIEFSYQNEIPINIWIVRDNEELVPDLEKITEGIIECEKLFKNRNIKNNFKFLISVIEGQNEILKIKKCYSPLYQYFIWSNGDIFPCCMFAGDTYADFNGESFGNIKENHIDIYNNVKEFVKNNISNKCKQICSRRMSSISYFYEKEKDKRNFI